MDENPRDDMTSVSQIYMMGLQPRNIWQEGTLTDNELSFLPSIQSWFEEKSCHGGDGFALSDRQDQLPHSKFNFFRLGGFTH